jgi:hypothetical protein
VNWGIDGSVDAAMERCGGLGWAAAAAASGEPDEHGLRAAGAARDSVSSTRDRSEASADSLGTAGRQLGAAARRRFLQE